VVHGADTAEASPAHKLVTGGALANSRQQLQCSGSASYARKKEMEGERREAVAPDIREGGRRLTSSEEDGGFGSLSSCDLDGDDLQGRRREVSVAAEGSECGGRWCGDPTGEGAERGRAVTVAWRGRTRDGRNNAFMAWARQQCFPRQPIWVRHVAA
jgi:hypothetical protein